MIDQAKNVISPTAPGPGHMADASIPDTTEVADTAYAAIPAGGNGEVGNDSTGSKALPMGVADVLTPPYAEAVEPEAVTATAKKTKAKAD